jgi:hypothetical protein
MLGIGWWPANAVVAVGVAGGAWVLGRAAVNWPRPLGPMALVALVVWLPLPLVGLVQRVVAAMRSGAALQLREFLPGWSLRWVAPALVLLVAALLVRTWLRRDATSAAPRFPT